MGLWVSLLGVADLNAFVSKNALEPALRTRALLMIGLPVGVVLVAALGYLLFRPSVEKVECLDRWGRRLSPLGWLWPLPFFFDWKVFDGQTLLRSVLALVWGLGLEQSCRACFASFGGASRDGVSAGLFRRWLRAVAGSPVGTFVVRRAWLVGLIACVGVVVTFAVFFSSGTILQHKKFGTSGFDLGLFDNLFFNLADGEWFRATVDRGNAGGGRHIQYHANFLAYLFVPFYLIKPEAQTLLVIQACVVSATALPIYLLAHKKLGTSLGAFVFATLYLLHEAVQSPVFYDFHFLTLAPFFIAWTLYFFESNQKWWLLLAWGFTLLLREDQGAVVGAAALVYLLSGRRPLWALGGGLFGVVWLALMRFLVMPAHAPDGRFQQHIGIFQAMVAPGSRGFDGVLKTIITNPPFTLNNWLEARKLEYLLSLAVPFLFVPFRKTKLLLLFVPASLFTLVSTNYPPPVSTHFQYTSYWMPMLALGTCLVLAEWRENPALRHRVPAALVAMAVIGSAMSYGSGGILQRESFFGGFRKIDFRWRPEDQARLDELHELTPLVPPNASVTATESVVPHVSARRDVYTLRQGAGDSEYLLLRVDEIRGGEQANHLLAAVPSGRWGVIAETRQFQLWKMGAPTEKNRAALRKAGHRTVGSSAGRR